MKPIKKLLVGISLGLSLVAISAKISLSQVPPYGPLVNEYNTRAFSATQRGDYDTAIINYQKAAQAAQKLSDATLRDCGVAGAMADIKGAEAAKTYLKEQGINSTTLKKAEEVYEISFRTYWDEFDIKRPDLINSCP